MAQWATTPAGYMNMDEMDNVQAADFLAQMVGLTRIAISKSGFEEDDVLFLIENWERVGQLLQTATYHQNMRGVWIMSSVAPTITVRGKTSAALLEILQKLLREAGDADAETHAIVFGEAQTLMRMFVLEFRQGLKRKDPDRAKLFDSQLQHLMAMRRL